MHFISYVTADRCIGNQDCQQMCKSLVDRYVCACNEGYILNGDGKTCAGKLHMLIFPMI